MMTAERIAVPSVHRNPADGYWVRTFRRYVAIGDSSTEGLEDPDGEGGYRGWADRLAVIIAYAQAEPLDYANLGVRSLHLSEIRATQLDAAMAMQPDLLSIFGGANDLLSVTCDFAGIRADLAAIFGEARSRDSTVVTFTMPDPFSINPFGRRLHGRMLHFNDIIREEAERYGVLVMDFQHYPMIQDPRLFPRTGCTATNLATSAWRPPWPGGSASRVPRGRGPTHSLRRCPGCGLVNSSPRTSNGLDDTSRPARQGHPPSPAGLRTYREAACANPCAQTLVVSRACKVPALAREQGPPEAAWDSHRRLARYPRCQRGNACRSRRKPVPRRARRLLTPVVGVSLE